MIENKPISQGSANFCAPGMDNFNFSETQGAYF